MKTNFKNPLLNRYAFTQLRIWKVVVTLSVYFVVVSAINILCMTYYAVNYGYGGGGGIVTIADLKKIGSLALPWMLGLAVLLLWIIASTVPSMILSKQVVTGAQCFFDLLPLSGRRKAAGLLVGGNLIFYPISVLTFVLASQYMLVAGYPIWFVSSAVVCGVCVGLFCNTAALLATAASLGSMAKLRNKNATPLNPLVGFFIVGFIFVFPTLSIAVSEKGVDAFAGFLVNFFGVEIPFVMFIAVLALVLAAWCFVGAARKLGRADTPVFSRGGAVGFIVFVSFVALGLCWDTDPSFRDAMAIATLVSWGVGGLAWLVGAGGSRSSYKLFELIDGGIVSGEDMGRQVAAAIRNSNAALFAILGVVWVLFATALWMLTAYRLGHGDCASDVKLFLAEGLSSISSYVVMTAFVALALELFILHKREYSYKHYVVGFAVACYVVVPLLAGIISGDSFLLSLSPLGHLASALNPRFCEGVAKRWDQRLFALAANTLAAMFLGWLVWKTYVSYWRTRVLELIPAIVSDDIAGGGAKGDAK